MATTEVADSAANPNWNPAAGGRGLERPIQRTCGPDGAPYVVDFGRIGFTAKGMTACLRTGTVWRITRTS